MEAVASTKSCIEFTLFYTPRGVVLAHRARFVASLRRNDGALERKRVYVRLGPLLDACAIARHPERRDSMGDIQRLKIPTHAGISARFTYSTVITPVLPGFTPSKDSMYVYLANLERGPRYVASCALVKKLFTSLIRHL